MPEMPEIQAHAERLTDQFSTRVLDGFTPFNFTALKTAIPPPSDAFGLPLLDVGRRGKYLLLRFEPIIFVVHLMQGGRLVPDTKRSAKPRGGQARFVFEPVERADGSIDETALLLTEQGKERRAGVWCVPAVGALTSAPLDKLGPEAYSIADDELAALFAANSMRVHGFLRDQRMIAGIGRRLANEICHRARVSPFANTRKLGSDGASTVAAAIRSCLAEGLEDERKRDDMSSSRERPSAMHSRTGEPCPDCGDAVRAVEYSGYTVNYCPTCQTGGKVLADNTTSKFLK
ncbi:MAG TPA: DNA-formamidopyrimidine glycosylase family protein [Ilumatobacteraceae bacterium]|nr:DNA-formamidopyrimidine glycosylase family protein [Ilumatobacteraceae bacterium]